LNALDFLIAQLTSANAAQYSVVSFVCHIHFSFFALSLCRQRQSGFGNGINQALTIAKEMPN
jgi:hypothetical protein